MILIPEQPTDFRAFLKDTFFPYVADEKFDPESLPQLLSDYGFTTVPLLQALKQKTQKLIDHADRVMIGAGSNGGTPAPEFTTASQVGATLRQMGFLDQ